MIDSYMEQLYQNNKHNSNLDDERNLLKKKLMLTMGDTACVANAGYRMKVVPRGPLVRHTKMKRKSCNKSKSE